MPEKNTSEHETGTEASARQRGKNPGSDGADRARQKIRIHLIEPHPGDALGSACGICYNDNVVTVLHTICGYGDSRDGVCLDAEGRRRYSSIKKDMNIIGHEKHRLPDFGGELRIQKTGASSEEKGKADKDAYGFLEELKMQISSVLRRAAEEGGWIALPAGAGHPMHGLVADVSLECVQALRFDREKLIFYAAHPYDYEMIGTGKAAEARARLEKKLLCRLLRCDDAGVSQRLAGPLIREIYGSACHEKFRDSLERTLCSYYVTEMGHERLKEYFTLQCNNVLYISVEAWPFYKTGGLGEVAYGYCKALQGSVNDVRILLPGNDVESVIVENAVHKDTYFFTYEQDGGDYACVMEEWEYRGLIYYLLKMKDGLGRPVDFRAENRSGRRFAAFCDAVLQKGLDVMGYAPTVCHCNDWQTALIPFLQKTKYRGRRRNMKTVYTIHFYGYKGIFPKKEMFAQLGMEKEKCGLCITCQEDCILDRTDLLNKAARGELLQMPPSLMSCMRAGIEFADAVTTVSKGYAKELESYPDFAGVRVIGIRNGIITMKERMGSGFPSGFSRYDELKAYKCRSKERLQRELGLDVDGDAPVVCMVARLAIEKGIELVRNILPFLLDEGAQMVLVGDDSDRVRKPYAAYFEGIAEADGRFAYRAFCEEIEYKTYAGADILLMPSLSEACGTTQMNAMQFGVIPVVSMLPAFRDTVLDYNHREQREGRYPDRGIGFYAYKDDCWVFLEVLKKVLAICRTEPEKWDDICRICSETDFGWKNGAICGYLGLYNGLSDAGR